MKRNVSIKTEMNMELDQYHNKIWQPSEKRQFVCTWENCNKTFPQSDGYKYHMRVHTGEKPFHCSICNRDFRSKGILKQHLIKIHDKKMETDSLKSILDPEYICTWKNCTKRLKQRHGLIYHIESHKRKYQLQMNKHRQKPERSPDGLYVCPWENCYKEYRQNNGLQYHIQTHYKEKRFKCYECNKSFELETNLKQHFVMHHTAKPKDNMSASCSKIAGYTANNSKDEIKTKYSNTKDEKDESNITEYIIFEVDENNIQKTVCKEEIILCD